jgi:hypothetical protein
MTASQDPVICTLTPPDLAAQARRWEELIGRATTGRTETKQGLRICFRPDAADELRALVTAERGCCPWAAWMVESSPATLVLEVTATADGIAALHAMFTLPA